MRKRLLAVQGPIQFIAGYIAMEWYRLVKIGDEETETVLLMYDFLMPQEMELGFVKVIRRLAASFKWHSIVFIGSAEMSNIMKGNYSKAIKKLHIAVGVTAFDEVILGRDYCGDGSPLIINSFPSAARVVYGDSFGIVGNNAVDEAFNWKAPLRSFASLCKHSILKSINGTHKKFTFDTAVLSLPLDWSGTYLDTIEVLIPSKAFVTDKISLMSASIHELSAYSDTLVDTGRLNYLFLLSNLSASGILSEKNESELYIEIIRQVTPSGARVLLKPHPRAPKFVLNHVADNVRQQFDTVVIDNEELASYPIELWRKLLSCCEVIPVYSASAYQIKYIYGIEVILALDDSKINRFVFSERRDSISKGNQSIICCVNSIKDWDGMSPLWRGCEYAV